GTVDIFDILKIKLDGLFGAGAYADIPERGVEGDGQATLTHDPATGELTLANEGDLETLFVTSDGSLFEQGSQNAAIGDFIQLDANLYGAISFSAPLKDGLLGLLQAGIPEDVLRGDLTVTEVVPGGAEVDLIYVPEPATVLMLAIASAGLLAWQRRRRAA
ncbi:MAG: PEP-CTERM sorting domain-containing protein, partial [bacterium]|nr:PEP-CTERM sorting domain-containing protein [bacterium]